MQEAFIKKEPRRVLFYAFRGAFFRCRNASSKGSPTVAKMIHRRAASNRCHASSAGVIRYRPQQTATSSSGYHRSHLGHNAVKVRFAKDRYIHTRNGSVKISQPLTSSSM